MQFQNAFGGMHGGAVGSIAERVAIACARTVAGKDKELFLGELSMSYLSAATVNVSLSWIGIGFHLYIYIYIFLSSSKIKSAVFSRQKCWFMGLSLGVEGT